MTRFANTMLYVLRLDQRSVFIADSNAPLSPCMLSYTVYQGNNTFSGYIDGISTIATPSVVGLWGQWSVYGTSKHSSHRQLSILTHSFSSAGRWLPEWYEVLVAANTKVGFNRRPWLSVPLLWTKNALSDSAPYRWSGGFATGNTAQRV